MSSSSRIEASVVIVGGGPVGLALAVTLGKAGIPCVLVERQLQPSVLPKGQNLTARSLEHFYFWGCAEQLHAARVLPPGFPIGGITAYEDLASEHWYAPAGRETVADFYYERNERLPQYLTESVLRNRLRELDPVSAMFGWSAAEFTELPGGVRVTAVEERTGERCEIEADYLVGCDGAHSWVREQAGIDSSGAEFDQRMVLAVFRSPELHARVARFPLRTTYRVLHPELEGYWRFFGRVDATGTWFFHAPVRGDATIENFDVYALIERAAGSPVACTFEHVGFWDLRISIADSYHRGRVFIAGDAAHSHPPYGAYGLNTGLEDAVNLGWKLAAVLRGWGGPQLLTSYTQERHPIFAQTAEVIAEGIAKDRAFLERYSPQRDSGEFKRAWSEMTGGDTAPAWYEPHYEGSPIVCGAAGTASGVRGRHAREARPGHHLAPAALSSGRNVFEQLGGAFTLLALTGDAESAAPFQAAARTLRIPLQVVADTFDDQRASYGRRLVLVRPDQYVAWADDSQPADPAAVLRQAVGAVDVVTKGPLSTEQFSDPPECRRDGPLYIDYCGKSPCCVLPGVAQRVCRLECAARELTQRDG